MAIKNLVQDVLGLSIDLHYVGIDEAEDIFNKRMIANTGNDDYVRNINDDFNLNYCYELLRFIKWPEDTKIHDYLVEDDKWKDIRTPSIGFYQYSNINECCRKINVVIRELEFKDRILSGFVVAIENEEANKVFWYMSLYKQGTCRSISAAIVSNELENCCMFNQAIDSSLAIYDGFNYQYIVGEEFKKDMTYRMSAWKTILSNILSQDRIKRNHELNNTEVYEFML